MKGKDVSSETVCQRTQRHKKEFLANYREGRYICAAAKKTGVNASTVWDWRQQDEQFRELFDETRINVERQIVAKLEAEADRRGVTGVVKPVYQGGIQVGEVREYSDTLLIFRLKGLAPDRYRDRVEHSGPEGGPIPIKLVEIVKDYGKLDTERL